MDSKQPLPSAPSECCGVGRQLCDFLFESLQGVLPFERVAIAALDGDRRLVQRAVRAQEPDMLIPVGYQGSLDRGTLASVLASGRARTLNDLAAYARLSDSASPTHLLLREGYQASLTCPLEHDGEAVGFLFFNARAADVYRPDHEEVAQRIAPIVAHVIASCAGLDDALSLTALTRSFAAIVRETRAPDGRPLTARVGVHCGRGIAGMAARMESRGEAGRVQVSEETARRLQGRFALEARGEVQIKGLGGRQTFWLGQPMSRG